MEFKAEYVVLPIIIVAAFLYMGLDGLPLTHPGNIKAADPFYHALAVENIIDTHQWKYYPAWVAFGDTKAMNVQPPLLYTQAAILTTFTGLPSWTTIYFIVCLFAAFGIGIVFFIIERGFKSELVATLAVITLVLPLGLQAWFYSIYIGLWIQVVAYFFVVAFVWMCVSFLRDGHRWQLWVANACVVAIIITHPQDLIPIFPLWAVMAWKVWKKTSTLKERIASFTALASFSAILFVLLLPHFIWVWGDASQSMVPGIYSPNPTYYDTSYTGGLTLPALYFFPWWVLIPSAISIIAMGIQWRKFKGALGVISLYMFVIYATPFIFKDPYYLLRMRALQPYVMMPLVALVVVSLLSMVRLQQSLKYVSVIIVGVLLLWAGYAPYSQLQSGLAGEHITLQKWEAYQWIQKSIPVDSKILMLEGTGQANPMFTKRIAGLVEPDELIRHVQYIVKNETMPLDWTVEWNALTVRHTHVRESGFMSYVNYPEWNRTARISDFDYVYMENQNEQVANINAWFVQTLKSEGYDIVYNRNGIVVVGRKHAA
jgi:hypothetical protein